MSQQPIKIAFICTANAARSQMAEGLARAFGPDHIVVQSAGVDPMGLARRSVAVMAEIGIDITNQWSKGLDQLDDDLDFVITLCDHADRLCPVLPAKVRLHWSIPDPHQLAATDDLLDGYRQIRNLLEGQIRAFFEANDILAD